MTETIDIVTAGSAAGTSTAGSAAGDVLARARLALVTAEESYAQYASERADPDPDPDLAHPMDEDWMAVLLAGNRVVTTGQSLVDHCLPGAPAAWPRSAAQLRDAARRLRLTALPLMYDLRSGKPRPASVEPADPKRPTDRTVIADVLAASAGRGPDPPLYYAVDAAIWLTSLQDVVTAMATQGRTAAVPG